MRTTRRAVLLAPAAAALAASLRGTPAYASHASDDGAAWPGFPHQDPDLARQTVGAAHTDIDKVRDLTDRHPALVNAAWDWGFGDWETALGAASHTGRREIAELLIARGARIDLFAMTMLGRLDAVKALLGPAPELARTLGPHGIPLLSHAEAGGEGAAAVLEYLRTVPGAGDGLKIEPLDAAEKARFAGRYVLPGGSAFEITLDKDRLMFVMKPTSVRLHYCGQYEFFPAGVPSVRFKFDAGAEKPAAVEITDHELRLRAVRSG